MPSEPDALGGHAGLWAADLGLLARLSRLASRRVTLEIVIYSRPQSDIDDSSPLHCRALGGTTRASLGLQKPGTEKSNGCHLLLETKNTTPPKPCSP